MSKGKRKKKVQGGNPSKRHRDRLNTELDNLARLLPFPEDTISKLDKISILRLTVSYLKAKSFFQVCATKKKPIIDSIGQTDLSAEFEGNGLMSQLLLEALDGFIMIITTDGQLFYVSESVKDFLGYSQAALIHQSLFKFLHVDDHKSVKANLVWTANHDSEVLEDGKTYGKNESGVVFKPSKCEKNFTCRIKCTLSHGGGFYKMFQCHGKMREIHIKKREIDSVEYGLFAVISPINSLPSPSTMEMVRKEAILGSQRRFQLDQNLNVTGSLPTLYKTYMDSHHLRAPMTPKGEAGTPTNLDPSIRPSFFPPSFNYVSGFRPGAKRRSSSSSGINDDSSTTDENASSEGSCDGIAPRRRVSFLLGSEENGMNYGKKEKISHRRMSAPTFPTTQSLTSSSASSYGGMPINAGNMNWLFPNPLTNPLLTYQDLLHRVDGTPFMTSGLLSPMFPGYSPGPAMYGSFSPNPFMKRASSFPNVYPPTEDPVAMLYPQVNGTNNAGQIGSTSVRMHGYDPFSYFISNPLTSRRSSSAELVSPSTNGSKDNDEDKHDLQDSIPETQESQTNEDEDIEINVTEDLEQPNLELPIIKVQDYDNEIISECKKTPDVEEDIDMRDDDYRISNKDDMSNQTCPEDAGIHETLADIAHSFTSKLDSIRSSFTMSLDRNVASCLGKK